MMIMVYLIYIFLYVIYHHFYWKFWFSDLLPFLSQHLESVKGSHKVPFPIFIYTTIGTNTITINYTMKTTNRGATTGVNRLCCDITLKSYKISASGKLRKSYTESSRCEWFYYPGTLCTLYSCRMLGLS